jgi:hypothetical protein
MVQAILPPTSIFCCASARPENKSTNRQAQATTEHLIATPLVIQCLLLLRKRQIGYWFLKLGLSQDALENRADILCLITGRVKGYREHFVGGGPALKLIQKMREIAASPRQNVGTPHNGRIARSLQVRPLPDEAISLSHIHVIS